MSPEQCRGIPTIDHRADIYSLGCMLFEMVVGQPPFVAEAPGDILMAHMVQSPPPLRTFDNSVPGQLDALVALMLAKDPAGRPQTMAEVVAACEALLGVPKAEFAAALRPPPGFPEQVVTAATQILPSGPGPLTPLRTTPARQTPQPRQPTPAGQTPPPKPQTPVARGESTEIEPTATPSRMQRTPSRAAPRRGGIGDDARAAAAAPADFAPEKPKWLLPVAILVAVIALGSVGAYFLSRPKPLPPPVAEPQRPAKPEPSPEPETLAKPGGFVPPSGEPVGRKEPRLDESGQALVKSPPAQPDKPAERKGGKHKGGSVGKRPEPQPGGGGFKAVGD
jgi:serine/threonine protein kinase